MTLALAAILMLAQLQHQQRLLARSRAVADMRDRLERTLSSLTERHARAVHRVREAVLEREPDNQQAILAWAADNYFREMERFAYAASRSLGGVTIPDADSRLQGDLTRLEKQLDRVLAQAQRLATALSSLRDAIAADDAEATFAARRALGSADRAVHTTLRIGAGMIRRTATWQERHAPDPRGAVPWPVWAAFAVFACGSLWWTQRPAGRLRRLAAEETESGRTMEEQEIKTALNDLRKERTAFAEQVSTATRSAERAQQSTRRADHEVALLKLYNDNLVNSLRSAVVATDARGSVTAFNRAARRLLDISDGQLDRPAEELPLYRALRDHRDLATETLARALNERQPLRAEGVQYAAGDEQRVLDLTVAPYLDESGTARGLLWIVDDVTEQLQTKTQLLLAERLAAVGRLSTQVAHEIRNPLSAIALNTELLEEEIAAHPAPPERRAEVEQLLKGIASEIERLTEVTEGYLQLARLPQPKIRKIDVNAVVEDLFAILRAELRAHDIRVRLTLSPELPRISADPGQLRQALINILRNSREAMADGGELTVTTRPDSKDGVHIAISDTGSGIPSAVLGRIFEPFFSTKPAGTGLGLSLTQQIVAEHRGTIRVDSQQDGTTFTIALPLGPTPDGPSPAEPNDEDPLEAL